LDAHPFSRNTRSGGDYYFAGFGKKPQQKTPNPKNCRLRIGRGLLAYVRFDLVAAFPDNLFTFLKMERTFNITWLVLIGLTVLSAVFANMDFTYIATIILGLSFLKFVGVAFFFMELKKANTFWKVLLVAFLTLLLVVVWAV
jgi:hypothetical protein